MKFSIYLNRRVFVMSSVLMNMYLYGCGLWTVSVFLNGNYSVSQIKVSFMWLKFFFCGYYIGMLK